MTTKWLPRRARHLSTFLLFALITMPSFAFKEPDDRARAVPPTPPDANSAARLSQDGDLVVMRGAAFDPVTEQPDFSARGLPNITSTRYGLVQLAANRPDGLKELRALGVRVFGYLPHRTYQIALTPAMRATLEAHPAVRWVGPYRSGYKVDPALWPGQPVEALQEINVIGFKGVDIAAAASLLGNRIGAANRTLVLETAYQPLARFVVPAAQVDAFVAAAATIEDIAWVEPEIAPRLENGDSVSPTQGNDTSGTPIYDQGITGTGQIVAVTDSGLDRNQCWFTQYDNGLGVNNAQTDAEDIVPPAIGTTFPDRKVFGYFVLPGASPYDDNEVCTTSPTSYHGTHVAGTVAGDRGDVATPDSANYLNNDEDGMAPNAQILFYDSGNDDTGCLSGLAIDIELMFDSSFAAGARIHTNSWGAGSDGVYRSRDQSVDAATWRMEDMMVIKSAGNAGNTTTVSSPGNSKNILTVGALGHGNSTTIAGFSSRGPTVDGRVKPDISAPGTSIASAAGDDNDTTEACPNAASLSGTSMAAPTVAGSAALVREYFTTGFYPSGQRTIGDAWNPPGMVLKATLLNSTLNLGMPSFNTGWGRVWLDNNLYFSSTDDDRRLRIFSRTNETGLETGESNTYELTLPDGGELRATLVWFDPPADLSAGITLVNNLDLEVRSPGGMTFLGNQFSGGESQTGGAADTLNTVEQVALSNTSAGTWTFTVRGTGVPGNGDLFTDRQGYALVISHPTCTISVDSAPDNVLATVNPGTPQQVSVTFDAVPGATGYQIYRTLGDCIQTGANFQLVGNATTNSFEDTHTIGGFQYAYMVRAYDDCGIGPLSDCVMTTSEASCPLPPEFDSGSLAVTNSSTASGCAIDVNWSAATAACPGTGVTYNVYRSTDPFFTPSADSLIATLLETTTYTDESVLPLTTYFYVVRAEDTSGDGSGPNAGNESLGLDRVLGTAYENLSAGTFADSAEGTILMNLESPWSITDNRSADGDFSYYNAADSDELYQPNVCAAITTPTLELQAATTSVLSYQTRFNVEADWDGVVVEISTDEGQNWQDLPPDGGYPNDFSSTGDPPGNACAYPASQGAFNGSSNGEFQAFSHDLSAFAGSSVQIRWRFSSDGGAEEEGFYLDDIQITNAETPQACCLSTSVFQTSRAMWPNGQINILRLIEFLNTQCQFGL
ncbi:S8 family serine peptidase [Sulfidibacter corallicola]|uniref:S8 family serine peptidase n=1 Tax=Sulfidibacter corallicola TaxID=2818388 RepID=A0A8A4TPU9_SULCO|nr:S8 family serine peptidase [Sulfidibacter corallicola]QTD51573.1 S8 family serine peptidase [Sulfidibacter corallicola]